MDEIKQTGPFIAPGRIIRHGDAQWSDDCEERSHWLTEEGEDFTLKLLLHQSQFIARVARKKLRALKLEKQGNMRDII